MDNDIETMPSGPTALASMPAADLTGQTVEDFYILRKLGQGGMGQVYLAEQLSLKRKVALKILKAELAADPTSLQRFKAEAEAVARATHANIVQVYAVGRFEALHYMALEYVEGRNLREFLAKKGPPELLLALSIMRQVAAALQRAAELDIIHRDIKPENILLTRKGEVKVADFGLARSLVGEQSALNLTRSGIVMGTPLYMSPEQVEGKAVDARSDIYSFGVTCYHMMAGQPPFEGENAFAVALKHVQEEPTPLVSIRPDLPEMFCAVVRKMMAKDPDGRYQTCRELLKDLSRVREAGAGAKSGEMPLHLSAGLVDLPKEESGEESGINATLVPAAALTPSPVQPPSGAKGGVHPRGRVWLLAVSTVVLALTAGVGLAGLQAFGPKVLSGSGSKTKPNPANPILSPEAQEIEAICYAQSPQKRERVLREAIDAYLTKNPPFVLGLCLDLAVLYFEQDRLDDAEKLFNRLEGVRVEGHEVRPYPTLVRFGRAIVLALRSQPVESNKLFVEIYASTPFKDLPLKPGTPPGGRPELMIWGNPQFRFWIAQALYYNEKNGLPKKDVPELLQKFRDGLPKS